MKRKMFILKPSLDLFEGIKVYKNTKLEFENENVKQEVSDLKFTCEFREKGSNYKSVTQLVIELNEGDILQYDEERGYFLPRFPLYDINDAINDYKTLKDVVKGK